MVCGRHSLQHLPSSFNNLLSWGSLFTCVYTSWFFELGCLEEEIGDLGCSLEVISVVLKAMKYSTNNIRHGSGTNVCLLLQVKDFYTTGK